MVVVVGWGGHTLLRPHTPLSKDMPGETQGTMTVPPELKWEPAGDPSFLPGCRGGTLKAWFCPEPLTAKSRSVFRAIALPVRQILKSFPPVPGIHSPFYREDRGMPVAWSLCFLERWLNFPRNGPNGVGRLQDGCSVSWVLREGPNQTSWDRVSGFT